MYVSTIGKHISQPLAFHTGIKTEAFMVYKLGVIKHITIEMHRHSKWSSNMLCFHSIVNYPYVTFN